MRLHYLGQLRRNNQDRQALPIPYDNQNPVKQMSVTGTSNTCGTNELEFTQADWGIGRTFFLAIIHWSTTQLWASSGNNLSGFLIEVTKISGEQTLPLYYYSYGGKEFRSGDNAIIPLNRVTSNDTIRCYVENNVGTTITFNFKLHGYIL